MDRLIVSPKDAMPPLLRIVTNFEICESFLLRKFPVVRYKGGKPRR